MVTDWSSHIHILRNIGRNIIHTQEPLKCFARNIYVSVLVLGITLCSKINFSKHSLILLPHLNCALVFLYAKMMIKCVFHLPYRVTIKIFPGSSAGKDSACSSGDLVRSLGWEAPLEKG